MISLLLNFEVLCAIWLSEKEERQEKQDRNEMTQKGEG